MPCCHFFVVVVGAVAASVFTGNVQPSPLEKYHVCYLMATAWSVRLSFMDTAGRCSSSKFWNGWIRRLPSACRLNKENVEGHHTRHSFIISPSCLIIMVGHGRACKESVLPCCPSFWDKDEGCQNKVEDYLWGRLPKFICGEAAIIGVFLEMPSSTNYAAVWLW